MPGKAKLAVLVPAPDPVPGAIPLAVPAIALPCSTVTSPAETIFSVPVGAVIKRAFELRLRLLTFTQDLVGTTTAAPEISKSITLSIRDRELVPRLPP